MYQQAPLGASTREDRRHLGLHLHKENGLRSIWYMRAFMSGGDVKDVCLGLNVEIFNVSTTWLFK